MYTLTIQFDTAEDLLAYAQRTANPTSLAAAGSATERNSGSGSTSGKGSATTSSGRAATTAASPSEDDEPGLDYAKDVQPVVAKFGTAHGKEAARDVLAAFEDEDGNACTKATQVNPSDWPALIKKVKAAHKKADAAKAAADADDD